MAGRMDEELINFLVAIGAMEYSKDNKNGKPEYRMTRKAKKIVPEIYKRYMQDFHSSVFSLWSKNIIEIVFNDEGDPIVKLNKNSLIHIEDPNLDNNEKSALEEIVEYWSKE